MDTMTNLPARRFRECAWLAVPFVLASLSAAVAQTASPYDTPSYDPKPYPAAPAPQPGYRPGLPARAADPYAPPPSGDEGGLYSGPPPSQSPSYRSAAPGGGTSRYDDAYRPPAQPQYAPQPGQGYGAPGGNDAYSPRQANSGPPPYYGGGSASPPGRYADDPPPPRPYGDPPPAAAHETYAEDEIIDAGEHFFGGVSRGLAAAIEYTYSKSGRPNGYVLGEDGGGAFFAGLRYGHGRLFTKDAGSMPVYWQGPSLGYDVGGEGAKTVMLVYNLNSPSDIFHRFGGIEGTAYLVGGVSLQYQRYGDIVLVPIRSGLGLRLGANLGYLKFTPHSTWNPF